MNNGKRKYGRAFWRKLGLGLLVAAGLLAFSFFLLNLLFPLPDQVEYSTIVTDQKGDVIHAYLTHRDKWRMKASLSEISPLLRKIIVAKEDKYFYRHPGVNPIAIWRAAIKNILRQRRTSGASTITMQVARALEPKARTWPNKLIELFRAFQLEWKYSKAEILQLYLNLVPYGGNIEGVKSASLLYFGKQPNLLSLAEITALSIIPNRPSSLVPGKNNARIVEERNRWLRRFAAEQLFDSATIRDAIEEPFTAKRNSAPRLLPHLSNKLKQTGSETIHTGIDLQTQLKAEKITADYVRSLKLKNIHNAAVVVIDNDNHQVISYIGSGDYYDSSDAGQVNGAAAIRQPGSTLKPFLYGLCIDEGLLTPKTIITDVAVSYGGYAPENYDRQFNGMVSMEYALEHSLNIPAVKMLNRLGKDRLVNQLAQAGFEQIRKDQRKLGLSMILGGCGSSLEELTGLFSVFANEGMYFTPQYTSDSSRKSKPHRLLSPAAAFMINETLSKINRPDFPLNWQSTERMPRIAWKTGTSYGRRDAWSIGYNKHFTIGVWVGNFNGKGVADLSGATVATPLLFRLFNSIDYDSDQEWYRQPADCDMRLVCPESGLPPGPHCPNRVSDLFIPLVSASSKCNHLTEHWLSADEKMEYCRYCAPETGYQKKWIRELSPEMQYYYEERKIAFDRLPPHNPACERVFRSGAPVIISPKNGSEYLINKKHPEPLQLNCRVANGVSRVYWYINNRFFMAADARTNQYFIPEEGPVKISCTDDKGRNQDSWIQVRYVDL